MKKEIFKVCVLGLVAVTLVTGCGKNEKEVTKVKDTNLAYTTLESKVEKVDVETEQLDEETLRLFINATAKDGESVWTIELGKVPYGIGLENWISYQGKDIYYFSTNSQMTAYDIETGKEIWTLDRTFDGFIDKVEEKDKELYVYVIVPEGHLVKVINSNDGALVKEYKIND